MATSTGDATEPALTETTTLATGADNPLTADPPESAAGVAEQAGEAADLLSSIHRVSPVGIGSEIGSRVFDAVGERAAGCGTACQAGLEEVGAVVGGIGGWLGGDALGLSALNVADAVDFVGAIPDLGPEIATGFPDIVDRLLENATTELYDDVARETTKELNNENDGLTGWLKGKLTGEGAERGADRTVGGSRGSPLG